MLLSRGNWWRFAYSRMGDFRKYFHLIIQKIIWVFAKVSQSEGKTRLSVSDIIKPDVLLLVFWSLNMLVQITDFNYDLEMNFQFSNCCHKSRRCPCWIHKMKTQRFWFNCVPFSLHSNCQTATFDKDLQSHRHLPSGLCERDPLPSTSAAGGALRRCGPSAGERERGL